MSDPIEARLPPELRDGTITRLSGGLSGAGVYRIDLAGRAYVLKLSTSEHLMRAAGEAGIAPRVVHSDAASVVTELVPPGRPFGAWLAEDRDAALGALGAMLARVHALPIPSDRPWRSTIAAIDAVIAQLADFARPAWFDERIAVARALPVPDPGPLVLSHRDVNPTNVVLAGTTPLLLDWDAAGPASRYFDLATAALFLRLDDASCLRLLAAYGEPATALPDRFRYERFVIAQLVGATFLRLAKDGGHPGDAAATALDLAEVYQRLRAGRLDVARPEGQVIFGLALSAGPPTP